MTYNNHVPALATIDTVRTEIDHLVDRMMAPAMALSASLMDNIGFGHQPSVNIIESDDTLIVESELPGMQADQLDIAIKDNVLTIAGRRVVDTLADLTDATCLRRERHAMRFDRSIRLPETVEHDHIDAVLEDGVLTITLPKAKHVRTRRIALRD
jgi:HSP20 family protein